MIKYSPFIRINWADPSVPSCCLLKVSSPRELPPPPSPSCRRRRGYPSRPLFQNTIEPPELTRLRLGTGRSGKAIQIQWAKLDPNGPYGSDPTVRQQRETCDASSYPSRARQEPKKFECEQAAEIFEAELAAHVSRLRKQESKTKKAELQVKLQESKTTKAELQVKQQQAKLMGVKFLLNCKPADVKPNRPAMTARRSRNIAFEQGYKCNAFDCPNKDSIMSEWDIDHIIPWAWSFNDTRSNLQALCPQRHKNKTDTERQQLMDAA